MNKNINFKVADRREILLVLLVFATWYIANDSINIMATSVLGVFAVGSIFGDSFVRTADFVFIPFITSFILALILVLRNQWKGKTAGHYDIIAGVVLMSSYILMAIAIALQFNGVGSSTSIFWLFDITKATLFHIGVVGMIVGLLYYSIVE